MHHIPQPRARKKKVLTCSNGEGSGGAAILHIQMNAGTCSELAHGEVAVGAQLL